MTIRAKLVLVLMFVGLVPLTAIGLLGHWSMGQFGREIAEEQRQALMDEAGFRIRRDLMLLERRLGRTGALMMSLTELQNASLEKGREQAGATTSRPVMGPADFAGGQGLGLNSSTRHGAVERVSYREPLVFISGPEGDRDGAMLSAQAEVLPAFRLAVSEHVLWQFTILDSGSYLYFPGCVPPADFDPTLQEFVEFSRRHAGASGIGAFVDPLSGRPVFGIGRPVLDANGAWLGVTGVLMALDDWASIAVPRNLERSASVSERVVTIALMGGTEDPRMFIIAESDSGPHQAAPGEAFDPRFFRLDSEEESGRLAVGLLKDPREVSLYNASVGGQECLIAATGVDLGGGMSDVAVLMVRPKSEIFAIADRAASGIQGIVSERNATIALVSVGVLVAVLIFSLGGSRTMARPIRALTEAATRVAAGDLSVSVRIRTRDELEKLAGAFNSMIPTLRDHVRVSQSLALATEVQQRLLPSHPPRVRGIDAAGRSVACDAVGGDYFDFLHIESLGEGELSLAVGDVTGHGIPAALLMTTVRAMLRAKPPSGSLGEHLAAVNTQLAQDTGGIRFMTLCWMHIDRLNGSLRFANAGHEQPMLVDPATGELTLLDGGGIPLGVEARWPFDDYTFSGLRPGHIIAIGTDGIWEARNPADEMFGRERFAEVLRGCASMSAREICDRVIDAVGEFRGPREQLDDITIVIVRVGEV